MEYGIQLYTLRNFLKTPQDVEKTFKKVADMGVSVVQYSGGCAMKAEELKKISDENGIKITVTHSPYERIISDTEKLCEEHKLFGAGSIGLGMMPERYRKNNFQNLPVFIEEMNIAAEKLGEFGLKLAYHNHFIEFKTYEGKKVLDILADEIKKLDFILDTYWVKFAKESNEYYINKLAGRLTDVHFKDYRRIMGLIPVMCELGRGVIDFGNLIPLFEKAGTQNILIEQDISKNPFKSLEISLAYLNKQGVWKKAN